MVTQLIVIYLQQMVSGSYHTPGRHRSDLSVMQDKHREVAPEISLCTLSDRCPYLNNLEKDQED